MRPFLRHGARTKVIKKKQTNNKGCHPCEKCTCSYNRWLQGWPRPGTVHGRIGLFFLLSFSVFCRNRTFSGLGTRLNKPDNPHLFQVWHKALYISLTALHQRFTSSTSGLPAVATNVMGCSLVRGVNLPFSFQAGTLPAISFYFTGVVMKVALDRCSGGLFTSSTSYRLLSDYLSHFFRLLLFLLSLSLTFLCPFSVPLFFVELLVSPCT